MGRTTLASHQALPAAIILLMTLLLGACSTRATQGYECRGQQLIITFAFSVDVTSHAFNAGLSRDAGVRLDFMRPLFDDHYLYCAVQDDPVPVPAAALERLRQRADVRAVDLDRINHPANKE